MVLHTYVSNSPDVTIVLHEVVLYWAKSDQKNQLQSTCQDACAHRNILQNDNKNCVNDLHSIKIKVNILVKGHHHLFTLVKIKLNADTDRQTICDKKMLKQMHGMIDDCCCWRVRNLKFYSCISYLCIYVYVYLCVCMYVCLHLSTYLSIHTYV